MGWGDEREVQEGGDMGIYVCIWLIHFGIQQKLSIVKQLYSNKDLLKKKKNSQEKDLPISVFDNLVEYKCGTISGYFANT